MEQSDSIFSKYDLIGDMTVFHGLYMRAGEILI